MSRQGRSTVIGLSGCSGSGKSTIISKVAEKFPVGSLSVLNQDNYYFPRDQQAADANGVINFDLPGAIDHARMVSDIESLARGESISRPEYTFNNPASGARTITIRPAGLILVEGIFIFHVPSLNRLLDYRVFVEAREHLMVKRRILRDGEERGYDFRDVLYRFEHHVIPAYDRFILPYRGQCDLVISNNTGGDEGAAILERFISGLAEKR